MEGESCYISHDIWKNVVVFEAYQGSKLQRVSMVGTGTECKIRFFGNCGGAENP